MAHNGSAPFKLQFPSRGENLILPKNYNNKLKLKSKIDKKRKKH